MKKILIKKQHTTKPATIIIILCESVHFDYVMYLYKYCLFSAVSSVRYLVGNVGKVYTYIIIYIYNIVYTLKNHHKNEIVLLCAASSMTCVYV